MGPPKELSGWDADGLWLGEVRERQLPWIAAMQQADGQDYVRRWRRGCRAFAAGVREQGGGRGRCAAYAWLAPGPTEFAGTNGVRWIIPKGAVWKFDAWSHPLAPGTYPDLMRYIRQQLHAEGCDMVLGQIECSNRASLRFHRQIGARRLGWLFSLRLGAGRVHVLRSGLGWRLGWGRMGVPLEALLAAMPAFAAAAAAPQGASKLLR